MSEITDATDDLIARMKPGMAQAIPWDCANSGYERKIHDPEVWRQLQEAYIATVHNKFAKGYAKKWGAYPSYSGFQVAVEVRDEGHRGRSVYALEPIKKGTKIWDPFHLAQFKNGKEMRLFLEELDHDLQCDALLWAYVEKGQGYVALALDPASFVNHGETPEVINLDENCFALRDIAVGEELLEDYSHFIGFKQNEVEWFHRVRGVAWKEEGPSTRSHSTEEYNVLGAPKTWGSTGHLRWELPGPQALAFLASCFVALVAIKKFLPPKFRVNVFDAPGRKKSWFEPPGRKGN